MKGPREQEQETTSSINYTYINRHNRTKTKDLLQQVWISFIWSWIYFNTFSNQGMKHQTSSIYPLGSQARIYLLSPEAKLP
ncbi:hypothetical protein BRADI_4g39702v3 [Brachypodium distachyon]|uniref:Uncharacterized protein n=1 Tax=Brachypodium distachyon TaxID=15368 RepID=A0A2K2CTC5_BRADI|nr:hypothetical protein BRADI_4g39702v3 [Brachypodium distachyon]